MNSPFLLNKKDQAKEQFDLKRTSGNHPVLLTGPLVYTPEHVLWKLPWPNLLWKSVNLVLAVLKKVKLDMQVWKLVKLVLPVQK
jgi:hypothetical protein